MRVINFNAGPAGLPLPALEEAQRELLDFEGSGMSIIEHSHRGKEYDRVHQEAKSLLKDLLGVPSSHEVFFMQGGASMQFATVPMNFLRPGKSADYVITGTWAEKALDEARIVGTPRVAATTINEQKRYVRVPLQAEVKFDPAAQYAHTTSNNTIFGTQFHPPLDTGAVPHICDMSSDFLWKPFDVSKFAMVYAGAQKNIGPSGIVAIVADTAFVKTGRTDIPKIFRYSTHLDNDSLYNTPPTFSIYLIRNVLRWLEGIGGLSEIEKRNREKASILYGALDRLKDFYVSPVEVKSRSVMNIVFRCASEALDDALVAEAKKAGMVGLKGHRSAGGIRVSTYNAVSVSDVKTLAGFLDSFSKAHG